MFKSGFDIDDNYDDNKLNENGETNPQEARLQSIQRCIQSLVHACQCRDANCRSPSCQKMKRVVSHTRTCKRKKSSGCPVCKQLIALCCYHAKHCMVSHYAINKKININRILVSILFTLVMSVSEKKYNVLNM